MPRAAEEAATGVDATGTLLPAVICRAWFCSVGILCAQHYTLHRDQGSQRTLHASRAQHACVLHATHDTCVTHMCVM